MTLETKSMTLGPPAAVNLELSHPFFYTIRDNHTGALLFTGIAMNPNAG
jgi:serine protease inhibitor